MIRRYQQKAVIRKGERGELSKCHEELAELQDAHNQGVRWHAVVEAADLINSTYTFIWRKYKVPFFIVIMIALSTAVYKPFIRWLRRL
jgi:hypothetical protein